MKRLFCKAIKWTKRAAEIYRDCHIGAYSAQAAFFVLVSAVPFAAFAASVLSVVVPSQRVMQLLSAVLSSGAGDYVAQILHAADSAAVPVASVSMVFVVWSATNGIRALAQGIGLVFDVQEKTARQVVLSVMFALAAMAVLALSGMVNFAAEAMDTPVWLYRMVGFVAQAVVFTLAYTIFSHSGHSFGRHFAGGCVAAAGWQVFSFGYGVYIEYFSAYPALYGWMGGVMLFMLWLYFCMNIVLWGAVVNREILRGYTRSE